MLPPAIKQLLAQKFEISYTAAIHGGSINSAAMLCTNTGNYFLKWNNRLHHPGMFNTELAGLQLMASTITVNIPAIVESGTAGGDDYLLMQFITAGNANSTSMAALGTQLAAMHRHSQPFFGLGYNNYIGSLPQCNNQQSTWANFYMEQRLQPLVAKAFNQQWLTRNDVNNFELLYPKLPSLFSDEPPALLHGDLWSGNYLVDTNGKPWLIDPAIYYGHREMDIAMTQLFGGFDASFYTAYNNSYALQPGWQQRVALCQLYPLLVHVNLFGGSYTAQLRNALKKYL